MTGAGDGGERARKIAFLEGYESGLRDAWNEVIKLVARGYHPKEIQIYLKTKMASLSTVLQKKAADIGLDLSEAHGHPTPPERDAGADVPLERGYSYLVVEKEDGAAYDLFNRLVERGHPGLSVSRRHPDQLRSLYNLRGRIIWLTKKAGGHVEANAGFASGDVPGGVSGLGVSSSTVFFPRPPGETIPGEHAGSDTERAGAEMGSGGGFTRMSPGNLSSLASTIIGFMRDHSNEGAVVLFDAVEYLATQTQSFSTVIHLIQNLNENAAEYGSFLVVPVSHEINREWYGLLKKELTVEIIS